MTVAVATGMLAIGLCFAAPARVDGAAAACPALETIDFSSIQDAPTQVMEAKAVSAADEVPAHCHVQGYVVPQVGFELKLPTSAWNGKFLEIGCGGFCGSRGHILLCDDALRRGYACIVTDHGHTSTATDGVWAYNNLQAEIDYGFRATLVIALAGKAITQHYYGTPPKYSFFMGGSGGGRQALVAAQRFPWDFDGIIATVPALNLSSLFVTLHWNLLAVTDEEGQSLLTPDDVDVLHNAVVAKCDALGDGIQDGVIGYPPACQFDPAELSCRKGQNSGCLSHAQVVATQKVYGGPVTPTGEKLFPGGAMPGSERGAFSFSIGRELPNFSTDFFRYMGFMPDPGPDWNPRDFDFDADYKRLGMMEMISASNNPDLRRFKSRGGKLIIAQGWYDGGLPFPLNTIDYYEMVERTMGGRKATQTFARLFMVPGWGHGDGGGVNAIDFLSHLETWVEEGRAPDEMIAVRVEGDDHTEHFRLPKDLSGVAFTRPLYPYPLQYRYKGRGDPDDYRSFEPFDPTTR